jgi:hypothetical protein
VASWALARLLSPPGSACCHNPKTNPKGSVRDGFAVTVRYGGPSWLSSHSGACHLVPLTPTCAFLALLPTTLLPRPCLRHPLLGYQPLAKLLPLRACRSRQRPHPHPLPPFPPSPRRSTPRSTIAIACSAPSAPAQRPSRCAPFPLL